MTDIREWLSRQLDEDEAWARAACQAYPYATDKTLPEGGVHWRWVAGQYWTTVIPDPATDTYSLVGFDIGAANLATVEEWPTDRPDKPMPRVYANEITEMDSSAAGHIARHDPARVLAEVAAKRRILELHRRADAEPWWPAGAGPAAYCIGCGGSFQEEAMVPDANDCPVVRLLAAPYSGRPGWDPSWEVKE